MDVSVHNYVFDFGANPAGWVIRPLKEVGKWYSGGTPSMKNAAYWSGEIPWISPKDMKVSRLHDSMDHISQEAVADGTRLIPKYSVLMVIRGMILAHSFPVARAERTLAFNQDMKAVVVTDNFDSDFVLHWLIGNAQKLRGLTTESTHGTKRLPPETLYRVPFPQPEKVEQTAIAEALNDADGLIGSLDQLLTKKRLLKQAAIQQLVTGKRRLPGFSGEWQSKKLGTVGSFLKGSGVRKDEAMSGELPCIRYGEIYTRHNDYIKQFFSWISKSVASTAKRLRTGDLLFAGSGETKEEIGKCVAFVDDCEAYAGGDIVILRPENVDSRFMGYYLNTRPIRFQKASRGQGDAVVHISSTSLAEIEVMMPTVKEQSAIGTILADMDAEIKTVSDKVAKARAVKQGMMQELLTGRIRLR